MYDILNVSWVPVMGGRTRVGGDVSETCFRKFRMGRPWSKCEPSVRGAHDGSSFFHKTKVLFILPS